MSILFKTYNGLPQLHIYQEIWQVQSKIQLDDILRLLAKKELAKVKLKPHNEGIDVEMNGVIIDCSDTRDLKEKFSMLADLKDRFQKKLEQKDLPKHVKKRVLSSAPSKPQRR